MLSMNKYPQAYIDAFRAQVAAQVAAQLATYDALVAAAKKKAGPKDASFNGALAAFEPHFFNNMVLVLDMYFCHRARGQEGKDSNPLNEVRVLSNSIMSNEGIMLADKTIKMKLETPVLQHGVGKPAN